MIKDEHLGGAVWNALVEAMLNPELIAGQVEKLRTKIIADTREAPVERSEIEKALMQLGSEENRLLEVYRLSIFTS